MSTPMALMAMLPARHAGLVSEMPEDQSTASKPISATDTDGMNEHELHEFNMRAMGDAALQRQRKHIILPRENPLDLLFFRSVFDHMLAEAFPKGDRPKNDYVPSSVFQRTMERLFFLLEDPNKRQGFSAEMYDMDNNGYVGWSEFVFVCLQRQHDVVIRLSLLSRIFLTLDRPESSYLAQWTSTLVLFVIAVSSLGFILSTMPEFQDQPQGDEAPKAFTIFTIIEDGCLYFFVAEYLARLLTCWSTRPEVHDQNLLLAKTTGYEELELPSAARLLFVFFVSPANLIDLFAILPGVLQPVLNLERSGGFVVLRLVRLTRILRAPQIREPTTIIYRTIQRSTKALYVLAFNMGLGMVIFGSLMFLAEKGTWDAKSKTYQRYVWQEWNDTTDKWQDITEESPFRSIPHTFWWAIVTSTTVGYGDQVPTTSLGYLCAVALMLFSLVIAALPVGVIGNNFSIVWEELALEKQRLNQRRKRETALVKASMQRCNPFDWMSRLMVIDVWNERFPRRYQPRTAWDAQTKPFRGDFLGMARIQLELPRQMPFSQEISVPLEPDMDLVQRKVSGTLHLRYEWSPDSPQDSNPRENSNQVDLAGTLRLVVLGASNLTNVNCSAANAQSNPYCMVACYPKAPAVSGGLVMPDIWSTPVVVNSLSPRWEAVHDFEFSWVSRNASDAGRVMRVESNFRFVTVPSTPTKVCAAKTEDSHDDLHEMSLPN
eukprot:CAMPEP_0178464124 /NCGR_PEP_ID=MMETSP0689_2-20121128/50682_1 /TAXON_ID=160604 /ORGANISM="Amphidinium massartii, Strain CS-259" /LENGTH=714 /DNA_ID=CAMNT_0020091019 /DNA_START=72 /DNA_END=2213 /DNA_ORIENTATION=-